MGQGIYTMIGHGAIGVKLPIKSDGYVMELEEVFGRNLSVWLRQDYECKPSYLIVPVAVSDGFLAEYWDLKYFARQAFTIDGLQQRFKRELDKASERWRRACIRANARHGLKLPVGELLIVSDWD